jgi:hypothetical protein
VGMNAQYKEIAGSRFQFHVTSCGFRSPVMRSRQQPLYPLSMIFLIIYLIQVVNAAFDGIPLRPGKPKVVNGSSSSSTLSGLLYSKSQLLALDVRQESTCQPGYRMCSELYINQLQTNVILDLQAVPCSDGIYCCTEDYSKCVGAVVP